MRSRIRIRVLFGALAVGSLAAMLVVAAPGAPEGTGITTGYECELCLSQRTSEARILSLWSWCKLPFPPYSQIDPSPMAFLLGSQHSHAWIATSGSSKSGPTLTTWDGARPQNPFAVQFNTDSAFQSFLRAELHAGRVTVTTIAAACANPTGPNAKALLNAFAVSKERSVGGGA